MCFVHDAPPRLHGPLPVHRGAVGIEQLTRAGGTVGGRHHPSVPSTAERRGQCKVLDVVASVTIHVLCHVLEEDRLAVVDDRAFPEVLAQPFEPARSDLVQSGHVEVEHEVILICARRDPGLVEAVGIAGQRNPSRRKEA